VNTRTVEKPSTLLLTALVLGGIAFGIQSMARTSVPGGWSIGEPESSTQPASVQPQDLDVMMFLHQNAGS
jgi:hypothetical protein